MHPLTERIDVLDMIISVLKEHEKTLDELADRLENVTAVLERRTMR